MSKELTPLVLSTHETPQEILSADFSRHQWPISGGWGYTMEDAVVIETNISVAGVALEYKVLEYRTYEELIVFREKGKRYAGIQLHRDRQSLYFVDGKNYDKLEATVTCFEEADYDMLKADWEAHNAYVDDPEGREAHLRMAEEKKITFHTEGWFEISRFFGPLANDIWG